MKALVAIATMAVLMVAAISITAAAGAPAVQQSNLKVYLSITNTHTGHTTLKELASTYAFENKLYVSLSKPTLEKFKKMFGSTTLEFSAQSSAVSGNYAFLHVTVSTLVPVGQHIKVKFV